MSSEEQIEQDIREAYTGILSEEVIKGAIIWWREKARKLLEGKDGEIAALQADRSAFAKETQEYRDQWLQDQKDRAALQAEVERLKKAETDLDAQLAIQLNEPTTKTDSYMAGLLNGMLLAKANFGHPYNPIKSKDSERAALSAELEKAKSDLQGVCSQLTEQAFANTCLKAELEICRKALCFITDAEFPNETFHEPSTADCIKVAKEALSLPPSELGRKVMVLVSAALYYHHAKDREDSKVKKLKFIEACANYEHSRDNLQKGGGE